ncbi:MAG: glutaredoxin family protein [Deltaproteobacteria bacterium]|nr:glutaredoxin family protein [Deltaproteobacteria bacterium]
MVMVEIYSRNGCCLCKEAKDVINRVSKDMAFSFKEVDISINAELSRRFERDIPAVFINGKKSFKFRVDEAELRKRLRREIIRSALLKRCSKKIKTA